MRSISKTIVGLAIVACVVTAVPVTAVAATLTPKQLLGKYLYFDKNLSEPDGQACATCHDPAAGYADPDRSLPTSKGVIAGRFGGRNSPTAAYASLIPPFSSMSGMNCMNGSVYRGGQFWDGRASTLVDQAKGPFLNPLEMNNPSKDTVIRDVKGSTYASLFKQVYGSRSLNNVNTAYNYVADAIAAYEGSAEVNTYSSKYDAYVAGRSALTAQESAGLSLFNGKGRCYRCHGSCGMGGGMGRMSGAMGGMMPKAFSDFSYHNVGAPRNAGNPFYTVPLVYNPLGAEWIDEGLGGVLRTRGVSGWQTQIGKHRVQTLRNVALTAPYMHNGVFGTLEEVVAFYNRRDSGTFGLPEVPVNVTAELGNLGLTTSEESAIVAFLRTLSDGYTP